MEEINKSLKPFLHKTQGKTIKQVKQTVQDLKTEIEAIKKTQTEGILERKILVNERELQRQV